MANTPPLPCYIIGDDPEVRFALYIPLDHFRWALLHTYHLSPMSFSKAQLTVRAHSAVPRRNNILTTVTLSTTKKQSELTGKRNE